MDRFNHRIALYGTAIATTKIVELMVFELVVACY